MINVNGKYFTLKEGATTTEGTFEGNESVTAPYMAGHYKGNTVSYNSGNISFTIPQVQNYNSEADVVVPIAAYSASSTELSFKSMVNIVKVNLSYPEKS